MSGFNLRTAADDVQVMSAGTGVYHSEFNLEREDTNIFQIWIEPNRLDVVPRWDSREFPKEPTSKELSLLVSDDGTAPLFIHQESFIFACHLNRGTPLKHPIKHQAYALVSEGSIKIEGERLNKGDGLETKKMRLN